MLLVLSIAFVDTQWLNTTIYLPTATETTVYLNLNTKLTSELEDKFTAALADTPHTAVTVGSVYKPSLGEHVLTSLTCLIFSLIGQNLWEGHFIHSHSLSSVEPLLSPWVSKCGEELQRACQVARQGGSEEVSASPHVVHNVVQETWSRRYHLDSNRKTSVEGKDAPWHM